MHTTPPSHIHTHYHRHHPKKSSLCIDRILCPSGASDRPPPPPGPVPSDVVARYGKTKKKSHQSSTSSQSQSGSSTRQSRSSSFEVKSPDSTDPDLIMGETSDEQQRSSTPAAAIVEGRKLFVGGLSQITTDGVCLCRLYPFFWSIL